MQIKRYISHLLLLFVCLSWLRKPSTEDNDHEMPLGCRTFLRCHIISDGETIAYIASILWFKFDIWRSFVNESISYNSEWLHSWQLNLQSDNKKWQRTIPAMFSDLIDALFNYLIFLYWCTFWYRGVSLFLLTIFVHFLWIKRWKHFFSDFVDAYFETEKLVELEAPPFSSAATLHFWLETFQHYLRKFLKIFVIFIW